MQLLGYFYYTIISSHCGATCSVGWGWYVTPTSGPFPPCQCWVPIPHLPTWTLNLNCLISAIPKEKIRTDRPRIIWFDKLHGQLSYSVNLEQRTKNCQKTYNLFNWTSVQWIIDVGSPFSTLPWPAQDRVFRWTGRPFPLGQPPSWRGMWRLLEPEVGEPVWWTWWELLGVSRPKGKQRNKPGRIGGIWRNLWLLYPITCSTWPLHQLPVTLSGELKVGANQP